MNKYKTIIIFLFTFVLLQGAKKPFSALDVTIQFNQNIDKSVFHKYWEVNNGLHLSYYTPFYFGNILIGCDYMPFNSINSEAPDFQSYYLFIGWLYDFNIQFDFNFSAGISIGNYLMNFDVENENSQFESEIGLGYFFRIQYPINEMAKFNFDIGRELIFTYKKLNFLLIKGGITFTLNKPDWLEDFLE